MEYTEDQLTEWFDVSAQKPSLCGVYEVKTGSNTIYHSYWNGFRFNYLTDPESGVDSIDRAFDQKKDYGGGGWVSKWRGLSSAPSAPSDPSAPKKRAGNKRKTLYRVFAIGRFDFGNFMMAGFFSIKEANAFIKHRSALDKDLKFKIMPLRFRTPEA